MLLLQWHTAHVTVAVDDSLEVSVRQTWRR